MAWLIVQKLRGLSPYFLSVYDFCGGGGGIFLEYTPSTFTGNHPFLYKDFYFFNIFKIFIFEGVRTFVRVGWGWAERQGEKESKPRSVLRAESVKEGWVVA